MSVNSSNAAAARARFAILVIVGALFLVPVLVRATFSLSPSSPIRLNRGFERPPAKCHLTPPDNAAAGPLAVSEAETPSIDRNVTLVEEFHPTALSEHSPDALRGPPASSLS